MEYLSEKKVIAVNGVVRTFTSERTDESGVSHKGKGATPRHSPLVTSDDHVTAQFEFEGGQTGTMTASVATVEDPKHIFSISGSGGTLTIEGSKLYYFKATGLQ